MASIRQFTDSNGDIYYKVTAHDRGRRVTKTFHPEPTWSSRTTEKELNKFAASLESDLKADKVMTRTETVLAKKQADLEERVNMTVKAYAEGVYMPMKSLQLATRTYEENQRLLDSYILPELGDMPINAVTAPMIQQMLLKYQSTHAVTSTRRLYAAASGLFKAAYMSDIIDRNPMDKVMPPRISKDQQVDIVAEADKAYTAAELAEILEKIDSTEPLMWRTYINLLAFTGIRRGESLGLKWRDIDFDSATMRIERTYNLSKSKGTYYSTAKNNRKRSVDLSPKCVMLLKELRKDQLRNMIITDNVFTIPGDTAPMYPSTPTLHFNRLGKQLGIKNFHPHQLRHTVASISIASGADIIATSRRLGHSSPSVTLNVYTHTNMDAVRQAGDVLRQALGQ